MIIEPFVSKSVLLVKVIGDLALSKASGLVYEPQVQFGFTPEQYRLAVVVIDYRHHVIHGFGPFKKEEVAVAVRTFVDSFGKRVEVAAGNPENEVVVKLKDAYCQYPGCFETTG